MQDEELYETSSRPLYRPVKINQRCSFHLFIAEQAMTEEMAGLYDQCIAEDKYFIQALDSADAQNQLSSIAGTLPLTCSVYLSGSEAFMWNLAECLRQQGTQPEQIAMFKPLDCQRQVFCCHCYHLTSGVMATPAECGGCGLTLSVTDHFSRRHSAYFGYQADAEVKGELPALEKFST